MSQVHQWQCASLREVFQVPKEAKKKWSCPGHLVKCNQKSPDNFKQISPLGGSSANTAPRNSIIIMTTCVIAGVGRARRNQIPHRRTPASSSFRVELNVAAVS